ncbi:nucleolar protein 53 [Marchantia polymorpha subsp. ruderalis]|uniref:Ribosome biogenesis protein NOP53 n=2 Tax=Marchantia polymorpha TaxID=3197 RepID=A0A176WBZ1_MARPO|nr:hypothetical protein AXG93_773s1420 [Marchantia polymorpha subsp. ruderalis]PTQ50081.1 hypothetical protein MARPO_0001s0132 [Marchantia polymorpha]BBM99005.1 hypothetical protein Mp_1g17930 [Marchantia polymorpha subsp. ruderalis]|eukprot:PTQ50081.1 hypothetical protein MARPO_0001s0132 [Marchantia polymorpha]
MGKRAKTSRKGKKAWRANISTADTDDFITRQALEDRSGGPLDAVPDDSLFFVDKSKDVTIERKTKKHREKILHCDSVLQRNSLIPPLRAPLKPKRKRKDRDTAKPPSKKKSALETVVAQDGGDGEEEMAVSADVWEAGHGTETLDENTFIPKTGKKKMQKLAKSAPPVEVPAVEIDAPGCSYNPTFEDHQDALGLAVAQEMQKVYKKDLEPPRVPKTVHVHGFPVEQEDVFFLDADADDEDEEEDEGTVVAGDGPSAGSRAVKVKKLTRADLNRIQRRRANVRVEREKREKLKLKKDVLRLPEIIEDITNQNDEAEKVRLRRKIARAERRAHEPPRLGKHKFKPAPVQVLLTEEVTGSLRQIKGCYTLARERFKSLQRRGILEPRVKSGRNQRKKRIEYEQGSRGQKERDMHASREAEKETSRHALAVVSL